MQATEESQYREKVLAVADRMRKQAQNGRPLHHLLDELAVLALGGEPGFTLSEDGRTMLLDGRSVLTLSQKGYALVEERVRREWAQKMREEFANYHEHPQGGGECGACGAIAGANWMDPDYAKDGPTA